MLMVKRNVLSDKTYNQLKNCNKETIKKCILEKLLSKYGSLVSFETLTYADPGDKHLKWLYICGKTTFIIIVTKLPYCYNYIKLNISDLRQYYLVKKSYVIIRSTGIYKITLSLPECSCRGVRFIDGLCTNLTIIKCLNHDITRELTYKKGKYIIIGNYVSLWNVYAYKKVKLVSEASALTNRVVTNEYYLDSYNQHILLDGPFTQNKATVLFLLNHGIKSITNKDLIQALKWPLGKPSVTFFRLWKQTVNHNCNRNLKSIINLLKRISRKNVTESFGLGDLLISVFAVVRKQANKLNINPKHITFKNLWKDISLIQLYRFQKIKNKRNKKVIKENVVEIIETHPFNPWMVDISREVEECYELRLNLLNKHKYPNDWPVVSNN